MLNKKVKAETKKEFEMKVLGPKKNDGSIDFPKKILPKNWLVSYSKEPFPINLEDLGGGSPKLGSTFPGDL